MKISDIIGEKFGGRYKSLTRQIFDDLANRNYSALKQKFAARNPKGARYFVDLPITEQMIIKKLPDSDESSEGKALVFSENHMGLCFGVGEEHFKDYTTYQEIMKWRDS
jgi:hypothetical protein